MVNFQGGGDDGRFERLLVGGTFSGTVRIIAGKAISITEGSFNLPYETRVNP
jgi:hypothetical protein